jgi:hypothetical protein
MQLGARHNAHDCLVLADSEANDSAMGALLAAAGRFLMLSDLHFDPMSDPRVVDRRSVAKGRVAR